MDLTTTASGKVELFESPTIVTNGVIVDTYNRNRNSSNTPTFSIYHAPIVTLNGTLLEAENFGANGGNKQGVGSVGGETVFILKQNTKYLLKYTSNASNNSFSEKHIWCEI